MIAKYPFSTKLAAVLVAFTAIQLVTVRQTEAATYYVDQNNQQASDTNAGTQTLPWLTLSKAASTVVAGDTVIVKPGRYTDPNSVWEHAFNPANSGTANAPITFRSDPMHQAVLVRRNNTVPSIGIESRNFIILDGFKSEGMVQVMFGDNVIVKNFDITMGSIQGNDPSLNWGLNLQGSTNSTLQNNYVHNMLNSGNTTHNTAAIMVGFDSSNNVIENNTADAGNGTVYSAFGQKGGGVNNNTWRNNMAMNAAAGFYGMGSTDETKYCVNDKYFNNIIINSTAAFSLHHNSTDWTIANNTAYKVTTFLDGGYYEESTNHDNLRMTLYNNVVYQAVNMFSRDPSSVTWTRFIASSNYNLLYNVTNLATYNWGNAHYSTLANWNSSSGFDTQTVLADPLFVNAASGDFHLQTNSPARGKGKNGTNMGAFATGLEEIGYSWGPVKKPLPPVLQ